MLHERSDLDVAAAKELKDIISGAITQPDPDDFWKWPKPDAQAMEVLVLGHDDESVFTRVRPDRSVGAGHQADGTDVD